QLQFTHADLTDSRQIQTLAKKGPFTTLLLDPPRTGAQEMIQHISLFRPKHIIYISCNPATFARDAHKLVHAQGYRFTQACVVDLFPQTAHVEVMGWFEAK
ncbi:MAG: 23S rRNA (uracil(1939)-C(5))-methyltransferase, partial [Methylococcales bacterium]|nr:23S rRNA (uracil(1939)-C(5))-methyltransferase [Methylococcales bacterium]